MSSIEPVPPGEGSAPNGAARRSNPETEDLPETKTHPNIAARPDTEAQPMWVDSAAAWDRATALLERTTRLALDVECDGFHRYPERVCLVQVATDAGEVLLLDVLALSELGPFGRLLGDPAVPVIAHAADFDVRSLRRDFGFQIRGLIDTAIAAQFTGATRTGLASVVLDRLGVELDKPKRLQRLDWSQRPLPADALDYAAADVAYLLALHDNLWAELEGLGRAAWVVEECRRLEDAAFAPVVPPEDGYVTVSGARDLTPAARAVLRELFMTREAAALSTGRPPHWILSATTMLDLSRNPRAGLEGQALQTLRPAIRSDVRAALRRGIAAPPLRWPFARSRNPWDLPARARLARLKVWRTEEAAALGLDVGLVWPLDHLKRLALAPGADPAVVDAEHGDVRAWQWRVLGDSLERAAQVAARDEGATGAGLADGRQPEAVAELE